MDFSSSLEEKEFDIIKNEKDNNKKIKLNNSIKKYKTYKEKNKFNFQNNRGNNLSPFSTVEVNQELNPNEKFELDSYNNNTNNDNVIQKAKNKLSLLKIQEENSFEIISSYANINSLSKNKFSKTLKLL